MQSMLERDAELPLTGRVEMDDAYLGGRRSGAERGRGAPGKTPFVAAVETTAEGQPARIERRRVKGFRKRMQFIRTAADERDFYAMKSLHFEKMSAARSHQRSIRINDQYRLVIELRGEGKEKVVHIIEIEDYH